MASTSPTTSASTSSIQPSPFPASLSSSTLSAMAPPVRRRRRRHSTFFSMLLVVSGGIITRSFFLRRRQQQIEFANGIPSSSTCTSPEAEAGTKEEADERWGCSLAIRQPFLSPTSTSHPPPNRRQGHRRGQKMAHRREIPGEHAREQRCSSSACASALELSSPPVVSLLHGNAHKIASVTDGGTAVPLSHVSGQCRHDLLRARQDARPGAHHRGGEWSSPHVSPARFRMRPADCAAQVYFDLGPAHGGYIHPAVRVNVLRYFYARARVAQTPEKELVLSTLRDGSYAHGTRYCTRPANDLATEKKRSSGGSGGRNGGGYRAAAGYGSGGGGGGFWERRLERQRRVTEVAAGEVATAGAAAGAADTGAAAAAE
ncbi:hypothetical protein GGX14DRAFT_571997 [Mycena pura]|uniref:Uncharacterized protein n=1 Tax=Mycena pura TaxID=153505 RepID=A0AAD6Y9E1_9AGAR|nr:hypothetical protein GGX14DRAFT_571997 [Mycena pura]